MTSLFTLPLAAGLLGLGMPELVIIMVVATLFLALPIAIVAIVFANKRRQDELWHETARIALEKGQPLPPQLTSQAPSSAGDLRSGLIMVATGVALYFFLGVLGAIPAFIGVALLINWVFDSRNRHRAPAPENRPPTPPA